MKRFDKSDIWLTTGLTLLGWVLYTLYNQNGQIISQGVQINSQGVQISDVQNTTHIIESILLNKTNSTINYGESK